MNSCLFRNIIKPLLLACLLASNANAFVPFSSSFSRLSASATRSCTSGTASWTWTSKSNTYVLPCATGSPSLAYNVTSTSLATKSGTTLKSSVSGNTANTNSTAGIIILGAVSPRQTTFSSISSTGSSSVASFNSISISVPLAAAAATLSAQGASTSQTSRSSDHSGSARSQDSSGSLIAPLSTSVWATNITVASNTSSSAQGTSATTAISHPSSISAAPITGSKAQTQGVSSLTSTPVIATPDLVIPTTSMVPSGTAAVADGLLLAGLAVDLSTNAQAASSIATDTAAKASYSNRVGLILVNTENFLRDLGGDPTPAAACGGSGLLGHLFGCLYKALKSLSDTLAGPTPDPVDLENLIDSAAEIGTDAMKAEKQQEEDDDDDDKTLTQKKSAQSSAASRIPSLTHSASSRSAQSSSTSILSSLTRSLSSLRPQSSPTSISSSWTRSPSSTLSSTASATASGIISMYGIYPPSGVTSNDEANIKKQLDNVAVPNSVLTLDSTIATSDSFTFLATANMTAEEASDFTTQNPTYNVRPVCGPDCVMMDATFSSGPASAKKNRRSLDGESRSNRFAEREQHKNQKRDLTYQSLDGENQELRFLSNIFVGSTANWDNEGIPDRYFFDDSAGNKGDVYLFVYGADTTNFVFPGSTKPGGYSDVQRIYADGSNGPPDYSDPVGTCLLDKIRGFQNGVIPRARVTVVQFKPSIGADFQLIAGLEMVLAKLKVNGSWRKRGDPASIVIPFNIDDSTFSTTYSGQFRAKILDLLIDIRLYGGVTYVAGYGVNIKMKRDGRLRARANGDGGVPLAIVAGVQGIGVVGGLTQAGDYANAYSQAEKDNINLWTVSEDLTCVEGKASGTAFAAGIAAAVGHYRQCLPDSDFPPKGTPPHYQDTGETVISNLVTWSISRGLAGVKALFNGVDDLDCEEAGILHKRDSPAIKACMLNSAGATVSIPEVPYTVEALGVGTDATVVPVPDFLLVPNVNSVGSGDSLQSALNTSTEFSSASGINTASAVDAIVAGIKQGIGSVHLEISSSSSSGAPKATSSFATFARRTATSTSSSTSPSNAAVDIAGIVAGIDQIASLDRIASLSSILHLPPSTTKGPITTTEAAAITPIPISINNPFFCTQHIYVMQGGINPSYVHTCSCDDGSKPTATPSSGTFVCPNQITAVIG